MTPLEKIRQAGFVLELEDGQLAVAPFSKLTAQQLDYLKAHKAEIIMSLQAEQPDAFTVYTSLGEPVTFTGQSQQYRDWLIKMNPKRRVR